MHSTTGVDQVELGMPTSLTTEVSSRIEVLSARVASSAAS